MVPCLAQEPGWEPASPNATVEESTPHFRKAFWGDSKSQIREKETAEFVREEERSLTYKTEVGGVPVGMGYTFVDDKLVSAGYLGSQQYRDAADYHDDYANWKKLLTNRLGEPNKDSQRWLDDRYKNKGDRRSLGRAIKRGHVIHYTEWNTADSKIRLRLWGEDAKVNLMILHQGQEMGLHGEEEQEKVVTAVPKVVGNNSTQDPGREPINSIVTGEGPTTALEEASTTSVASTLETPASTASTSPQNAPTFEESLALRAEEPEPEPPTSIAEVEEQKPHFREAFWGDSKSQVMWKETAELVREDRVTLVYDTRLAGVPGVTTYSFVRDKLVSAEYLRQEKRQSAEKYLADYQTLKTRLTSKYGTPHPDVLEWSNEAKVWERNPKRYALALLFGHLKQITRWETPDTEITLSLYSTAFGEKSVQNTKLVLKIAADSKSPKPATVEFAVRESGQNEEEEKENIEAGVPEVNGDSSTQESGREPITSVVAVEEPATSAPKFEETTTTDKVEEPTTSIASTLETPATTASTSPQRVLTFEEPLALRADEPEPELPISAAAVEEQKPHFREVARGDSESKGMMMVGFLAVLLFTGLILFLKSNKGDAKPKLPTHSSARIEAPLLSPKEIVNCAKDLRQLATSLLAFTPYAERQAQTEYEAECKRVIHRQLHSMPLNRLKQLTKGGVRTTAVEASGIGTVGQLINMHQGQLQAIPGVGPVTAARLLDAARDAEDQLIVESRIRFDIERKPVGQTNLLRALYRLDVALEGVEARRPTLENISRSIAKAIRAARPEFQPIRHFFSSTKRKNAANSALKHLYSLLNEESTIRLQEHLRTTKERLSDKEIRNRDVWADYERRSAHYNALLAEVGGIDLDTEASRGFASAEITEMVQQFELDQRLLKVTLRGYQAFGAKYALIQKHSILGDEMGLGKTIEALAVLCHLKLHGGTHFLVVCPASVLVNWEHEVLRHTRLQKPLRLHGPERIQRLNFWKEWGGLAVTTFDTLRSLGSAYGLTISAMIVDEAHFVKNPRALRTVAARHWLSYSAYSMLMTGTPMENRVEEFQTLVDHVQPDTGLTLENHKGFINPNAFRRAVSPVYLRRNQSDVLDELPEKIETEEWFILGGAAANSYRRAVASGNFMAMRRCTFLTNDPNESPKLSRLLEIIHEAAERGLKTVVFSFFLDVIDRTHETLGSLVAGTITGAVPAGMRQQIVDQFTDSKGPAVLVNQIQAGGVGLNLQAASVVILTEPQWKPSTEEQAIARCHRMGQARRVEVHRLLAEDTVDDHMVKILRDKSVLFDAYARGSVIKDATPDAVDTRAGGQVMSQRECESQIITRERQRLGISPQYDSVT